MKNILINRRNFIAGSVLGLSGLVTFGSPVSSFSIINLNDKVRVGVIGNGRSGKGVIESMKQVEGLDIVACCDISAKNLDDAIVLTDRKAKAYQDYGALLAD